MKKTLMALTAASLFAAAPAFAEGFAVRGGIANVNPKSDNGTVAGAAASVDDDTRIILGASYYFDDQWEFAFDIAPASFEHTVNLSGLGNVVELKHRPITAGFNWHFLGGESAFSPYVGLGYNWTSLSDVRGINALAGEPVDLKDSDGLAASFGADYNVSETFFLRGEARYIDFDTDATLNGAGIGTATVDPWVISLQAGLRF